ncbi:MAG: 3-hydroxyacyl-ACP dehydratase FabZ [Myxococcales bacterium]|nr:3-hydroxyacyl-ACP dehydratase FabZ [Myxococcales bacterium]
MGREAVEALLPHRGHMLMVDEIVEIQPGERAVARKYVRDDEFWCAGHFPGRPILPGVLMAEALAQTAALLFTSQEGKAGATVYLVGMEKMRFRRMVQPGDVLELEVTVSDTRHSMYTFQATARVDGQRACTGSFLATVDKES